MAISVHERTNIWWFEDGRIVRIRALFSLNSAIVKIIGNEFYDFQTGFAENPYFKVYILVNNGLFQQDLLEQNQNIKFLSFHHVQTWYEIEEIDIITEQWIKLLYD